MKAKEFTINVPINISIAGDGEPEVNVSGAGNEPAADGYKKEDGLDPNPVMVPPLQQDVELRKAEQGKDSVAIDKITQADVHSEDADDSNASMDKFRKDMGLVMDGDGELRKD
tara:strand:- start:195 stop:533 length:339 start_codon:yes stop_codon:yes gene_type:complete